MEFPLKNCTDEIHRLILLYPSNEILTEICNHSAASKPKYQKQVKCYEKSLMFIR